MADFPLAQFGNIRIASPCHMKWTDMEGDDHVRHCSECALNVYNFSEMTEGEITALLNSHGESERLCVGWYQRTDGTMIMKDCPVGVRLIRQKLHRTVSRIAAAVGMLITGSVALAMPGRDAARVRTYQPFAALCEWLSPTAPPPMPPGSYYGGMMVTNNPPPPGPIPAPGASTPECGETGEAHDMMGP